MMVKKVRRIGAYNNTVAMLLVGIAGAALIGYLWMNVGARHKIRSPQVTMAEGESPMIQVRVFNASGQLSEPVAMAKVVRSEEEWKQRLTPEQYRVARNSGTEPPFCGTLLDNKKEGVYTCICCGLPLFASNAKFNSNTGWPSFFQPICKENVTEKSDTSHGMLRAEINCARCDAHLGHVFDDGPRPTGMRFCLNSESLDFTEQAALAKLAEPGAKK